MMRWNPLYSIEWKKLKPFLCTPLAILVMILVALLLSLSSHSGCCKPMVGSVQLFGDFWVHIPYPSCERYYAIRYWSIDYILIRLLFAVFVCHIATICRNWRSLIRKVMFVILPLSLYLCFFIFLIIRGLF